jgi:uncharacterized phiE125 gp8 family phage protein
MALSIYTAATVSPISESQVQAQIRNYNETSENISLLIDAVRERGEQATNRAFNTQTWEEILDGFPADGFIEVSKPPLLSVTHVKYRDTSGTLQTWAAANYIVTAPAGPRCARGRISLAYGITWPSTYGQAGDVQIRFVCGYGSDADDVPAILRAAMLLDIATLYANPENVIKGTIVAELPSGSKDIYRAHHSYPTTRRAA